MYSRNILLAAALAASATTAGAEDAAELEKVEVNGRTGIFRNRIDSVPPMLSFGQEYFQRFEPLTVGDMLKRVPGVSFSSDVLEYDFVQLRGAGAEFTQILINGRRVPGSGPDRSVQVDRIPAEMVERIELLRAPSASIDAQGVAGTINIVLKQGAAYRGGNWRLGAQHYDDGELKGLGFASVGGQNGNVSWSLAADFQQRYNPKEKEEFHRTADSELAFMTDEADTRDGEDKSISGDIGFGLSAMSSLKFSFYRLETDREETEETFNTVAGAAAFEELEGGAALPGQLAQRTLQVETIDQVTTDLRADWEQVLSGGGLLNMYAGWAKFEEDTLAPEFEWAYAEEDPEDGDAPDPDLDEIEELLEQIQTEDTEIRLGGSYAHDVGSAHYVYGVEYANRQRDALNLIQVRGYDAGDTPGEFETDEDQVGDGRFDIEETLLAAFVDGSWELSKAASLQAGLRAEHVTYDDARAEVDNSFSLIAPSVHYRYQLGDNSRFRASLARTVRRPRLDELTVFMDVNEDFVETGNIDLDPETANGIDLGWERSLVGNAGIIGINLFFRDISDRIERTQIGTATGSEGDEVPLLRPENIGDAKFWGAEFDSSFPLTFVGAPQVGVFFNLSLLRSEVTDPATGETRDFNFQPEYVANLGFDHHIESIGASYGFSYQKRGESQEVLADETVILEYEGNLEAYIEKSLGEHMTLRFAVNNLLDAEKTETITAYDDGEVEEREVQIERAGPLASLVLRGSF